MLPADEPESRLRICAVMVVPMLAPMMMPTACLRVIMPALTKPTTITVVPVELWMMAVTSAPAATDLKILPVMASRAFCSFSPAIFSRAELMVDIPKKNIPRPPKNLMARVM